MTMPNNIEPMEVTKIVGGRPLSGTVRPASAKNSVLPILAATLLCGDPCTLYDVPRLRDVQTSLALMAEIGAYAVWHGRDVVTSPSCGLCGQIPEAQAAAMRGSVFYLAPLLCRVGVVSLPRPGGCSLGPRPIDIHIDGLRAMGALVEEDAERMILRRCGPLHGVDYTLRLPSVGATLTLMMAACCAAGVSVLRGAACEPEIEDTAAFLCGCGAKITGAGTTVVTVYGSGGNLLRGCAHRALADRIAAATYAAAVAAAGGEICIEACEPRLWQTFLDFLQAQGCEVQINEDAVRVGRDAAQPLRGGATLRTGAYPEFATDAAPLAAAVLLGAEKNSKIYDALFQNRFACGAGFAALGANVKVSGRELLIAGKRGGHRLSGAALHAPDLRGGAALLVAALAAQGTSVLYDAGHIGRGYERLAQDLANLGAACSSVEK